MKGKDIKEQGNDGERHEDRNMTILRGNGIDGFPNEYIPVLHLTGLWMWKAGFSSGDKVTIIVRSGILTIIRTKARN